MVNVLQLAKSLHFQYPPSFGKVYSNLVETIEIKEEHRDSSFTSMLDTDTPQRFSVIRHQQGLPN